MSGCSRYSERLAAFASDGEGAPDDDLQRHLPSCAACREELDEVRALLRGIEATAPRPARNEAFWTDFTRDVRVRVDDGAAQRKRRWRLGFVLAPLVAAAATVALVLVTNGRSTPLAVVVPAPPAPTAPDVAGPKPPSRDADAFEPADDVDDLDGEELVDVLAALDDEPQSEEVDDLDDLDRPNPIDEVEDMDAHQIKRLAAAL